MDTTKLFGKKVSRRKLVQAGSVAAGAVAVAGSKRSTFAAPYFAPRRFQGENADGALHAVGHL